MNSWIIIKVNKVGSLLRGISYKGIDAIKEAKIGYLPILRANNINGHINYNDLVFIPQKYVSEEQKIKSGDIIFAMSSGSKHLVGKAARSIEDFNGSYGAFCALFRTNPIIENKFVSYFFQGPYYKKNISSIAKGTNINNLKQEYILELNFPLPPFSEQRAIVAKIEQLLSDLDKGVDSLKTALEQLRVYRQAVLKKAFEGGFSEEWRKKNNNDKNDKQNEGDLPISWKAVKLGDVCTSVEYGSAKKSKKDGKIHVLRMGNIQNGLFDWKDLVYTDNDEEIEKYFLRKNDVLFNRTNSPEWVGKTAIYKGERPAIFAGYLIRINYIESIVHPLYLTYYLNSHIAKKYGNKVKSFGVNQSNINGTKLKTYPIPLAPLPEQNIIISEIESRLFICDNLEKTITEALTKSETLRQSILKKAFEGKLLTEKELEATRQEPDWEPAEKLLERIKAKKMITASTKKLKKAKSK